MQTETEPQETVEEPTEAVQQEATEEVTEGDQQPECICSVCGELVVPILVETRTGDRYRCPECKKFMKRLTKQEAAEEKEKASGPLVPTDVELTERAKLLMAKYLPTVYGVPSKERSKRIHAIIDTMTPAVATNPLMLHNHVKNFAPNADDRHLEAVITKVFGQLETEGYFRSSSMDYRPQYQQFVQGQPRQFGQYSQYGGRQQGNQYPPSYPPGYSEQWWPPRTVEQPKNMTVIVEGREIKTDMQGYMAWKKYQAEQKKEKAEEGERTKEDERRQEVHSLKVQKFQEEIKKIAGEGGDKGESAEMKALNQKVSDLTTKLEDKKEEERKKEIGDLHGSISALSQKIENQPTWQEQMDAADAYAARRGYTKSGKTTIDVLSDIGKNVDNRAKEFLNRVTPGGGEFKPDVQRTPEERRKKAQELEGKLKKKESILKAEDRLMRAAAKMG